MTVNTSSKRLNEHEPAPTESKFPAVWDLVYADIIERDNKGKEKYGTRLKPFNGRKVLIDAYQEALDLVVYLRQAIYEQDYNEAKAKFHSESFDEKVLWSPEKESQLQLQKDLLELGFINPADECCSCKGAVQIYLASDDIFRCRECQKRISRICDK